jgi:hypothetical protein
MRHSSPITRSRAKESDDNSYISASSSLYRSPTPESHRSARGAASPMNRGKSRRHNTAFETSSQHSEPIIPDVQGRVRVAVRCRPPFDDEATGGVLQPVVHVLSTSSTQKVSLEVDRKGKRREFYFDVCVSDQ